MQCMEVVMQVPDSASRPLFRAMDTDASGSVSLAELSIGLTNLVEGSEEVRPLSCITNTVDC